MAPTPVSPLPTGHPAPPGGTPWEEHRVRPLPSTEPGHGHGHEHGLGTGPAPGAGPGPGHGPRPDTRPQESVAPGPPPQDVVPVPARRAAHALVIMALEVVDRQRAPHHTRGAFPPHLVEMLRALARGGVPGQHLGPARIHRIHIHAAGPGVRHPDQAETSEAADYEVCATYARGPRLFAVAARIRVTGTGATCTALRLV